MAAAKDPKVNQRRLDYLKSYLATAKRLGMEDDETVVAARAEYRAIAAAARALLRL